MYSPTCERLSLFIVLLLSSDVRAEDWPMFGRSHTRNAVSPEKNPPTWWQVEDRDDKGKIIRPAKNIKWSASLGSITYGDPVVEDGRIWVGTNSGKFDWKEDASVLACLDAKTGRTLYRYVSPRLGLGSNLDWPGSSMACSPLIEGDRLWFVSNRCEVVCLDLTPLRQGTGEPTLLWKLDMLKKLNVFPYGTPMGMMRRCSVAGFQDLLYVITGNGVDESHVNVPAPDAPSLVCLSKKTGAVVWTDNSPGKNILYGQASSPLVIEVQGKTQVVAAQGDGWVRAFDARTGKPIWQFDTNPKDAKLLFGRGTRNSLLATPVFSEGRVYIGNGHHPEYAFGPAWLYCIDPTKIGDISPELLDGPAKGKLNPNSGMVWRFGGIDKKTTRGRFNRTVSNVAVHQGLVIAADIAGAVHCLDARTGQHYWTADTQGQILGSPLVVDGKVYVGNDRGDICIFALAKEKKKLAEIEVTGRLRCSPIFAQGVLYVASDNRIYAIAGTEKEDGEAPPAKERLRPPDAIFVPTPQDVVEKMLELAATKKTDLVYDLGCGDGRIVVTAAKKYGCRAVGFDLDLLCVKLARDSIQKEKMGPLVTIEQKDLFSLDLSQADVVTLYLGERLNAKLIPQLHKLKPGARIVSHQFRMEGIRPDRVVRYLSTEDRIEHTLYLWTVPLKKE